jgi:ADP-ribose pyrophosphatase YjhB (NUDIX family)
MPSGIPSLSDIAAMYRPRPLALKELNLSDDWRARWIDEQDLPENAPVNYAYAVVMMGDKGYVTRPRGAAVWGTVEGTVEGETPDAFVQRAVKEQMGATIRSLELLGFLECRATSHNEQFEAGFITVRPMYMVVAKSIDDLPADSAYEKRRLPMNEYMMALRGRYPELTDYFGQAGQRYAIMRAKGEA